MNPFSASGSAAFGLDEHLSFNNGDIIRVGLFYYEVTPGALLRRSFHDARMMQMGLFSPLTSWGSRNILDSPLQVQHTFESVEASNLYLIQNSGNIDFRPATSTKHRYYLEGSTGDFYLSLILIENGHQLVEFPDTGDGFERYGTNDAGGFDAAANETVGAGDRFITPKTAAALLGTLDELHAAGITLALGDMSSSNGSDPWQAGFPHHAGHGHNGNRTGLDVDFRYLNAQGDSFQSSSATTAAAFDLTNNTLVYNTAHKYGFTVNYRGTRGPALPHSTSVRGHNDHGHIGRPSDLENVFVHLG